MGFLPSGREARHLYTWLVFFILAGLGGCTELMLAPDAGAPDASLGEDACAADCGLESACGDGVVDDGEQCDDGNTTDGDGCSAGCTAEATCGNGDVEVGEQCDDGNAEGADGCTAACQWPAQVATFDLTDGAVETMSTEYTAFEGLAPLAVTTEGSAHVLVSFFVPYLGGSLELGSHGEAFIGVQIDGELVAEAAWENAYWGQGGPTTALAVAEVGPGEHSVTAVWRAGNAGIARAAGYGEAVVTATTLNELSHWIETSATSVSGGIEATGNTFAPFGLPDATINVPGGEELVLATMSIPSSSAGDDGDLRYQLQHHGSVGGAQTTTTLAETRYSYDSRRRSTSMLALLPGVRGTNRLEALWRGTGRLLRQAPVSQLTISRFAMAAGFANSVKLDGHCESSPTWVPITGQGVLTLDLSEPRPVLLAYQVSEALTDQNGTQGEVGIAVDSDVVAFARVQSQGRYMSMTPLVMTVMHLDAGMHTIEARIRQVSGPVCVSNGPQNLTALVLD